MASRRTFNLMARATRGLEWVAAAEIKGRLQANLVSISHREVHFCLPALDPQLGALRTVDDVFLTCGTIGGLDHTRASLQQLTEKIGRLDLSRTLHDLRRFRPIELPCRFDLVGSCLGRRNYNRYELEAAAGQAIATKLNASPQPSSHRAGADISWRLHLRGTEAYLGLRLLPTPLHRRPYRSGPFRASLHPPIAAAMALLAGLRPNEVFLDPFCGSGTISIEAAHLARDLVTLACDIDPLAVSQTRHSAAQANIPLCPWLADTGRLPLNYRAIDRIASNLPWERTVQPRGILATDLQAVWHELRRVLHSESRIVVLSATEPVQVRGFVLVLQCRISSRGRWSTLSIFTLESHHNPSPIDEWGLWGDELLKTWTSSKLY